MKGIKRISGSEHNKRKKLIFSIILVLLPFIFLVIIELTLRIFKYGDNLSLFVDFPGKELSEYKIVNPVIGKKYFSKLPNTAPHHDIFLKEKPDNGFRIFVLGSSTVFGFPYEENVMFTKILAKRLQDSYPDKKIEVINTAITAINSFTLLDFIDEIMKEDPDAILIYAGHNEFYGALGPGSVEKPINSRTLRFLHLDLLNLRLYQLLRNVINTGRDKIQGEHANENTKGTLMKVIADNKEIPYKSEMYNRVLETYEKNISKILEKTQNKNIPVFISEVVSNIKGIRPFCSTDKNGLPPAIPIYEKAIEHEKRGEYKTAQTNFYLAKDLDCIRFRASEEINGIIHDLAEQMNAYLVPMKNSYFEEASPNKIIGNNLLTEHVHPNIEGYFLMADAFFNAIADSKLIGKTLNAVYYKNSAYYKKNWGYTDLDSLVGMHRVNILKSYWPFQPLNKTVVDYVDKYRPLSTIDSLALAVIKTPTFKINEAHKILANKYTHEKDYLNAYKEYYAAILYNPFEVKDYLDISNCLIKINDLPLALEFLNKSLDLQETLYAYLKIGEILSYKDEYEGAIKAFKKALELDEKHEYDEIILSKLYESYLHNGNDQESKEILDEIKSINPGYQYLSQKNKRLYVNFIPLQVESQIKYAINYYNKGDYDTALDELLHSIEIKETSIANRIIGDILLRRNDKNAIVYYLKAYPDYKKDINYLYDLGILYLVGYRALDKATETLEEMKRLDPDNKRTSALEEKIQARK